MSSSFKTFCQVQIVKTISAMKNEQENNVSFIMVRKSMISDFIAFQHCYQVKGLFASLHYMTLEIKINYTCMDYLVFFSDRLKTTCREWQLPSDFFKNNKQKTSQKRSVLTSSGIAFSMTTIRFIVIKILQR